jgi:hypothetical protein
MSNPIDIENEYATIFGAIKEYKDKVANLEMKVCDLVKSRDSFRFAFETKAKELAEANGIIRLHNEARERGIQEIDKWKRAASRTQQHFEEVIKERESHIVKCEKERDESLEECRKLREQITKDAGMTFPLKERSPKIVPPGSRIDVVCQYLVQARRSNGDGVTNSAIYSLIDAVSELTVFCGALEKEKP